MAFLTAACAAVPSPSAVRVTTTFTPLPSPTALPTFGLVGSPAATPPPTSTRIAPVPIPLSTASVVFPLDKLRVAYILKGNLYVQDGASTPRQLSNGVNDHRPIFSDDGRKLVFARGADDDIPSVFSVDADGTDERPLITKDWLAALRAGTRTGQLVFISGTHRILFNTYSCHGEGLLSRVCTVGLFLTDTDSGKTTTIRPPAVGGEFFGYGNFSVSPDGKLIALAHDGQIDILNATGAMQHSSIMKYTPSKPLEVYPRVFWLADSSELIVGLPADAKYYSPAGSGPPTFTLWRYRFGDNSTTQISLSPSPAWVDPGCVDLMSISPDGKQAIYFTYDHQVYRANLLDGSTQLYLPHSGCGPAFWTTDSNYFVYGGQIAKPAILGSAETAPVSIPGFFWGWIDAKQYIYETAPVPPGEGGIQILVGGIEGGHLITYESNFFVPGINPYSLAFVWLLNK